MAAKLNYDSKSILNIKFSPKEKGYDPLEVDQIFDKIIEDYNTLMTSINDVVIKNEQQQIKLSKLKKDMDEATLEISSLKNQLDVLKKTSGITGDNYKLVTKVAAYERVLHRKGIDLKKALSDPDNC